MLNATHKEGYAQGIKYMEEKMLSACDTDKPIEISSKAFFVISAERHLQKLFDDIEKSNS